MSGRMSTSATLDTTGVPTSAEISVDDFHYADLEDDLELTVRFGDAIVSVALTPDDAEQLADELATTANEVRE
jgi:hypothetical protein